MTRFLFINANNWLIVVRQYHCRRFRRQQENHIGDEDDDNDSRGDERQKIDDVKKWSEQKGMHVFDSISF